MITFIKHFTLLLVLFAMPACKTANGNKTTLQNTETKTIKMDTVNSTSLATFGGGCFWCMEAVFQQMIGVEKIESGYSGGNTKNPTYKEVCTGETGHAEVIQITYNPGLVSFAELLRVFFTMQDPTTLNRQGNDVGTQYRSVIFCHNTEQQHEAEAVIQEINKQHIYPNPVVTQVVPFSVFYKAEDYHQNYYNKNKEQSYCRFVIQPKVEKFEKIFNDRMKK